MRGGVWTGLIWLRIEASRWYSCVNGNETSVSIKSGEFLQQMENQQHLNQDYVLWSQLLSNYGIRTSFLFMLHSFPSQNLSVSRERLLSVHRCKYLIYVIRNIWTFHQTSLAFRRNAASHFLFASSLVSRESLSLLLDIFNNVHRVIQVHSGCF